MIRYGLSMRHLLDQWRATGAQPKWFGLGFIQLKLDEEHRVHFWHPDLAPDDPDFENEFHDHRYNFSSQVLVGGLRNEIVTVNEAAHFAPYDLHSVCCSGGGATFIKKVSILDALHFTVSAGDSYSLDADTFHRVTTNRCVTIQTRGEEIKERANVISLSGRYSKTNPFDRIIPTKDLWEYISDLIPDDKVENPGYHLKKIEKGVLGEASKIKEEVEEFLDALDQESKIMALVELSDLVGAINAYCENHAPGISLDDLKSMAKITRRAFENGRRS